VSRWESLANDFERRTGELAAQAEDHHRQQLYCAWARSAIHRSIEQLTTIIELHIANFPEVVRSELRVEVAEPATAHAEQRVLCVNFAADSVHLHAQWREGTPPSLHVLLSRKRAGRDARLITLPGGWLRPASASGFQLCSFDGSGHEIALEDVAYRALRLLAAGI
jgi:hypothetical protein